MRSRAAVTAAALVAAVGTLAAATPASAAPVQAAAPAASAPHWATAALHSSSGKRIGTVTFRDSNGGVAVTVNATWVKPGFHGFHLHTIGKCEKRSADPKDAKKVGAFLSSGGHWTKAAAAHPAHTGDLPVVYAGKNTKVAQTVWTDRFRVADLFDKDGTAVVIHQGGDNYANIPSRYKGPDAETKKAGDGGSRAACGVIRR